MAKQQPTVVININGPVTGPIHTGSGQIVRQSNPPAAQPVQPAQPKVVINNCTTTFFGNVTGPIYTGDEDVNV